MEKYELKADVQKLLGQTLGEQDGVLLSDESGSRGHPVKQGADAAQCHRRNLAAAAQCTRLVAGGFRRALPASRLGHRPRNRRQNRIPTESRQRLGTTETMRDR